MEDIEPAIKTKKRNLEESVHTVKKQIDDRKSLQRQFEKSVTDAKFKINTKIEKLKKHYFDIIDKVADENRMEQQKLLTGLQQTLVELNEQLQLIQPYSDIAGPDKQAIKNQVTDDQISYTPLKHFAEYSELLVIVDEADNSCREALKQHLGMPYLAQISRKCQTMAIIQFKCTDAQVPNHDCRVSAIHSDNAKLSMVHRQHKGNEMKVTFTVIDAQTKKTCLTIDPDLQQGHIKIAARSSTSVLLYPSVWLRNRCSKTVTFENNGTNSTGDSRKPCDSCIYSLKKSKRAGLFNVRSTKTLPKEDWKKVFKIRVNDPVAICVDNFEVFFAVIQRHAVSTSSKSCTYSIALFCKDKSDSMASFQPRQACHTVSPSSAAGEFLPSDICFHTVDGKGVLLVADEANHTIYILDHQNPSNGQLACIGEIGSGCPMLRAPTCLDVDDTGVLCVGCNDGTILKCKAMQNLGLFHTDAERIDSSEREMNEKESSTDHVKADTNVPSIRGKAKCCASTQTETSVNDCMQRYASTNQETRIVPVILGSEETSHPETNQVKTTINTEQQNEAKTLSSSDDEGCGAAQTPNSSNQTLPSGHNAVSAETTCPSSGTGNCASAQVQPAGCNGTHDNDSVALTANHSRDEIALFNPRNVHTNTSDLAVHTEFDSASVGCPQEDGQCSPDHRQCDSLEQELREDSTDRQFFYNSTARDASNNQDVPSGEINAADDSLGTDIEEDAASMERQLIPLTDTGPMADVDASQLDGNNAGHSISPQQRHPTLLHSASGQSSPASLEDGTLTTSEDFGQEEETKLLQRMSKLESKQLCNIAKLLGVPCEEITRIYKRSRSYLEVRKKLINMCQAYNHQRKLFQLVDRECSMPPQETSSGEISEYSASYSTSTQLTSSSEEQTIRIYKRQNKHSSDSSATVENVKKEWFKSDKFSSSSSRSDDSIHNTKAAHKMIQERHHICVTLNRIGSSDSTATRKFLIKPGIGENQIESVVSQPAHVLNPLPQIETRERLCQSEWDLTHATAAGETVTKSGQKCKSTRPPARSNSLHRSKQKRKSRRQRSGCKHLLSKSSSDSELVH